MAMSVPRGPHDVLLQWLSMQGQRRASPETGAKAVGASKDRPELKRERALQSLTPASLTPGLPGAASPNVSRGMSPAGSSELPEASSQDSQLSPSLGGARNLHQAAGQQDSTATSRAKEAAQVFSNNLDSSVPVPAESCPLVHRVSQTPSEDSRVFVYGSLLPGLHNNGVLEHAKLLGHHQTWPSYDMFSLGYYPAVCGGGATAISGALYQVSRGTLAKLDRLEGHPQWYQRELVDLSPKGALELLWAWMYLMSRSEAEICGGWAEHVASGDWLAFHTKGKPRAFGQQATGVSGVEQAMAPEAKPRQLDFDGTEADPGATASDAAVNTAGRDAADAPTRA